MSETKLVVDGQDCSLSIGPGVCETSAGQATIDVARVGEGLYSVIVDGQQRFVAVSRATDGSMTASTEGLTLRIAVIDPRQLPASSADAASGGAGEVRASMPGKVVAVLAEEGQSVKKEQGLVVVEAMKMQNEMRAPCGGTVVSVAVRPGDSVAAGDMLACVA